MELEQIVKLINAVSEANVESVEFEKDDFSLKISKSENKEVIAQTKESAANAPVFIQMPPYMPQAMPMGQMPMGQMPVAPQMPVPQMMPQAAMQNADSAVAADDSNLKIVKSPLVGTFYSAASPDDEPFVKVGDKISKGKVVGIIEAMKLMNDIESDFDGEVVEIMVNNEDMIEYGQPLFTLK